MRLLFVANVCGMDDSRLTIANHSGPTQKKNKKFRFDESMNLFFQYVVKLLPGLLAYRLTRHTPDCLSIINTCMQSDAVYVRTSLDTIRSSRSKYTFSQED